MAGWSPGEDMPTTFDYLLTQAVSRIYLDNVPHIQSSWVTQGMKIGQVALGFGADDMGSIMIEENVVSAAGTTHRTSIDDSPPDPLARQDPRPARHAYREVGSSSRSSLETPHRAAPG